MPVYTPWPREGGGGLAERYPTEDESLLRIKVRFVKLLDRAAGERFPAQMLLAQTYIIRAFREKAGGLSIDSSKSIAAASAVLDEVERQLDRR